MDPELADDEAREAKLHPAGHAAKAASRGMGKVAAMAAGAAIVLLLIAFVVLGVAGGVLWRPGA